MNSTEHDPFIAIYLGKKDIDKYNKWVKEQNEKVKASQSGKYPFAYYGCCGGGYTYHITYTSLGVIVKVNNNITGDEIDLTDYNDW